ncbi:MAG: hypothetical protein WA791_09180, partial [Rhodomicrobium sp.]
MSARGQSFIVSMEGLERPEILESAQAVLARARCKISGMTKIIDGVSGRMFMRLRTSGAVSGADELSSILDGVSMWYDLSVSVRAEETLLRTIIMVSKLGHCLRELLERIANGEIRAKVCGVVSNHEDHRDLAAL